MSLIVHTTDLSGDDTLAFAHAVALAARHGSRLLSVHATTGPVEAAMPRAAELVARWSDPESAKPVEHEHMIHQCCDDVADTLLDALRRVKPDLVVSATHVRTGLSRVVHGSISESLARNVGVPSLLVPLHGDGFVDRGSGAVRLGRVLIPLGDREEAEAGARAAGWLLRCAAVEDAEVTLLHVADGRTAPEVTLPDGVRIVEREAAGALEPAIVEAAERSRACAIVMATRGHDSLTDVLFGSRTERVLHEAPCPILSVPLGWRETW